MEISSATITLLTRDLDPIDGIAPQTAEFESNGRGSHENVDDVSFEKPVPETRVRAIEVRRGSGEDCKVSVYRLAERSDGKVDVARESDSRITFPARTMHVA